MALNPLEALGKLARSPFVATAAPAPYRRAVTSQSVRGTIGTVRELPAAVDAARQQQTLTWTGLARKLGCSRQYLRKALGEQSLPIELLEALTRVLGLTPTIRVSTDLAPYLVHP